MNLDLKDARKEGDIILQSETNFSSNARRPEVTEMRLIGNFC